MTNIELLDHFAAAALLVIILKPELPWEDMCWTLGIPQKVPGSREKHLDLIYRHAASLAYGHARAMMNEKAKLNIQNMWEKS